MKIHIFGAAGGEVTGSCYQLETSQAKVIIDCGLFQGGKVTEALNLEAIPDIQSVSAVLLTHAHLDHTGRLPLLVKAGYQQPILGTPATLELTALVLRDAARIQVTDTENRNRKRMRAGKPLLEPLFTPDDAENTIQLLRPITYQTPTPIAPGIEAIWTESGHMLGSSSIQLIVHDQGLTQKIVFSGDIGPRGALILRDYEPFKDANFLFMESTYGSRDHRDFQCTVDEFVDIVREAVAHHGKILVPTFAIGRAQVILLLMAWMFRNRLVDPFPIYLDSPMAIEATKIYHRHQELYDDEMIEFIHDHPLSEDLKSLHLSSSADESRAINDLSGPCMVLAGAGMCNAGRILHHLKANLWKPHTHVMIVGYQGHGSLGRRLLEAPESVKIFGEEIAVKAQIHTLGGFSAHAGRTDLLNWFDVIAPSKPRIFLTHGENRERLALADAIMQKYQLPCELPELCQTIEL